jgi:hypothetical protein
MALARARVRKVPAIQWGEMGCGKINKEEEATRRQESIEYHADASEDS